MRFAVLTIALIMVVVPASAQNLAIAMQEIIRLNRVQLEKNTEYDDAQSILNRQLSDNKNHVIGRVYDVLLNPAGMIESLYVDFKETGYSQKVYLDYAGMRVQALSDSYNLAFNNEQLELMYPQILADTATASGDDSGVFSLKGMVGQTMEDEKGERLGTVKTIFFSRNGSRAEAIYVDMGIAKDIVLPFNALANDQNKSGRLIVQDAYAQAAKDYIAQR